MIDAVKLRKHYQRFLRPDRILLTGHSHQAWPDVARLGLIEAFDDAAEHVDAKWERAMAKATVLREAVAEQIGGAPNEIALAQSSHELVTRFVSALPLRTKPHILTTQGEFHSMGRQLRRLGEEVGIELQALPIDPIQTLASRLNQALRKDTAALMVSTVLFGSSSVVPGLTKPVKAALSQGTEVLLDAYHQFNVLPWEPIDPRAFVTAGGYKYAQWGEGCCFMRVPADCNLRPIYTGWFSDFGGLSGSQETLRYGSTQADRFAGSTYDPSGHYRAAKVIEFFKEHEMDVDTLRASSLRQTQRIMQGLASLEIITPKNNAERAGFVAVRIANAEQVVKDLRQQGIFVDARNDIVRFGPAPYTTDDEIDRAVSATLSLVG